MHIVALARLQEETTVSANIYAQRQMLQRVNGAAFPPFSESGSIHAVRGASSGASSYLRCNSYLNAVMLPLFG